ncbi:cyclic dof factor 1-like isoform X1 [Miscanthus floridulus]|uniref:cyclic dof factor 1-like isoform X1 n=1 Tax=Miscanthus floridulus TaxID=154761 RepID=UPI00345820F3
MGEGRAGDGLIKLFGKTIPVPETAAVGEAAKDIQQSGSSGTTDPKGQENTLQDSTGSPPQQEVADTEDSSAAKTSSADKQQGEAANQKEKLKKPDKILPCPRCNSMDTKFCYYNNYNIKQPRHFCKNCQRYWTAGGAMRNVPVGAGRRKSKSASAASHFLQRVRAALPIDPLCTAAKTNGTVLSFGSDMSSLDLTEQMKHLKEKLIPIAGIKNGDERSVGSCTEGPAKAEDSNQKENVTAEKSAKNVQHPCMNGVAMWPFSCAPPPACYTPGSIAIPFYPAAAAYWGCMVPGAWNAPWPPHSPSEMGSTHSTTSPASTKSNCFTPGKRPRDCNEEGDTKGNGKVWVPKTIRIDDVDEVARSSILSLIGINGDKAGKDGTGCKLARVFERKEEARTATHSVINGLPFLQGNPAALSRSLTFQEGS